MKTARKVLLLTLCAVLLVSATVMGTLAYLTDDDAVTNTFTVGNVAIVLDEEDTDGSKTDVTTQGRDKANAYKLIPGSSYKKDPMVTVLKDSENAYIRMIVTIDKKEELDAIGMTMADVFVGEDTAKWVPVGNGVAGEGNTMVYEFRYYQTVNTLDGKDKALEPLFTGITVPGDIDNDELASLSGLKINIVAQAIQADGFNTAELAWAEWK